MNIHTNNQVTRIYNVIGWIRGAVEPGDICLSTFLLEWFSVVTLFESCEGLCSVQLSLVLCVQTGTWFWAAIVTLGCLEELIPCQELLWCTRTWERLGCSWRKVCVSSRFMCNSTTLSLIKMIILCVCFRLEAEENADLCQLGRRRVWSAGIHWMGRGRNEWMKEEIN